MSTEGFYSDFVFSANEGDLKASNKALMKEIGQILAKNKSDFIDLLNESDIPATADMTDVRLVDLFIENIDKNPKLALGASLLVNMHNRQMGFDGEQEISDEGVKAGYSVLRSYFSNTDETDEDFENADDEEYSGIPGLGQAISGAVQGVSGLGSKIAEGQQRKKYGVSMMAEKKEESKALLMQQIMAQKQAQIEAQKKADEQKQKTTRTLLIAGGVVVGLGILALVIYKIKKGKK